MKDRYTFPKDVFCLSAEKINFPTDQDGKRKWEFNGVAYSGKVLKGPPNLGSFVFDLSTTSMKERVPVLREHGRGRIAGSTTGRTLSNQIDVSGRLYKKSQEAQDIMDLAEDEHPWEMSIYIEPGTANRLSAGRTETVNGREVKGPVTIFKNNRIREVSFCTLGADSETSAMAFSNADDIEIEIDVNTNQKGADMELQQKLDAMTAERDKLKLSNAEQEKRITQLENDLAERDAKDHAVKLSAMYANAGIALTDDNKKHLLSCTEDQAKALCESIKAKKPEPPAHLKLSIADQGDDADEDELAKSMIEMK